MGFMGMGAGAIKKSSGSARAAALMASKEKNKAAEEDVFLGVWQHFITTVKIGSTGSVLINSCAAAIQPPAEVGRYSFDLNPP